MRNSEERDKLEGERYFMCSLTLPSLAISLNSHDPADYQMDSSVSLFKKSYILFKALLTKLSRD